MIDCRQSDGLVAVATWGRGIYTTTLPTSGVDESTAPVAGLSLEAPHPNPARDHAAIGFTLPSAGTARLTLFDPLGREVARIVDAALEAGPHQATLDLTAIPPATLPNGAYFYRLDYGGHAVTRGVIVER